MAHGVVIDSLTSRTTSLRPGQRPADGRPERERAGAEVHDRGLAPEGAHPRLASERRCGRQQSLNLVTGSSSPTRPRPSGVERLWTQIGGRVTYSTSNDFTPPTIDSIDALPSNRRDTVSFTGALQRPDETGDAGTVGRQVVYDLEDNTGNWGALPLVDPGDRHWTGGTAFNGSHIQYFVEVCDATGNCGYSSNKGRYFDARRCRVERVDHADADVNPGPGGFYQGR